MFKLVVLSAVLAAVAAKPGVLLAAPYTTYTSVVAPATTTISKSASSVVHPSPVLYSAPLAYSHFIKKRSAGVLAYNYAPTTYVGSYPYAASPLYASSYASAPVISTPVLHSSSLISTPITYSHFIKKRSVPLLTTYVAPASFSHQSRVDITHNASAFRIASYPSTYISQPYFY